jgi:transposase InsO family protein
MLERTGDAGLVCRRCGVSRPTLRKWWRRYQDQGLAGLLSRSRRPGSSPACKVFAEQENWILTLRTRRKLGARRIQSELRRLHGFHLGLATIHKVLTRHQVKPLVRSRRRRPSVRYARLIPGEQVQMDTCKIANRLYQYTAVDDCTRYKVLPLFPRRSAANTLRFLEQVIEETPFPIQRIQTDRGAEFFAYKVQNRLREWAIKFRPIKPGSPHLNGKVERAQRTDIDEFYSTVDTTAPDLGEQLALWQHFYNWDRSHGGLNGKTPMDRYFELIADVPWSEDVQATYDLRREHLRIRDYRVDLKLSRLNHLCESHTSI